MKKNNAFLICFIVSGSIHIQTTSAGWLDWFTNNKTVVKTTTWLAGESSISQIEPLTFQKPVQFASSAEPKSKAHIIRPRSQSWFTSFFKPSKEQQVERDLEDAIENPKPYERTLTAAEQERENFLENAHLGDLLLDINKPKYSKVNDLPHSLHKNFEFKGLNTSNRKYMSPKEEEEQLKNIIIRPNDLQKVSETDIKTTDKESLNQLSALLVAGRRYYQDVLPQTRRMTWNEDLEKLYNKTERNIEAEPERRRTEEKKRQEIIHNYKKWGNSKNTSAHLLPGTLLSLGKTSTPSEINPVFKTTSSDDID